MPDHAVPWYPFNCTPVLALFNTHPRNTSSGLLMAIAVAIYYVAYEYVTISSQSTYVRKLRITQKIWTDNACREVLNTALYGTVTYRSREMTPHCNISGDVSGESSSHCDMSSPASGPCHTSGYLSGTTAGLFNAPGPGSGCCGSAL